MPKGHSIDSFPFPVSSYLPSSRLLIKPSLVRSSRTGYTEPGEGLHQPCVIVSISAIISAPFLGERWIIMIIQVLSHLRCWCLHPCIHMIIDFPISESRYKANSHSVALAP